MFHDEMENFILHLEIEKRALYRKNYYEENKEKIQVYQKDYYRKYIKKKKRNTRIHHWRGEKTNKMIIKKPKTPFEVVFD